MRVLNIIHDSVVDGEGLRTVIFFAGCPHHCLGCHNPESWKMTNGTRMSIEEILEEIKSNPLTDVTFSGGEPMIQAKKLSQLAEEIKKLNKNIWVYSGYTYEELVQAKNPYPKELLKHCDVLVDGPFILEERDLSLDFRGSKNQRLIHLNKVKKHQQLEETPYNKEIYNETKMTKRLPQDVLIVANNEFNEERLEVSTLKPAEWSLKENENIWMDWVPEEVVLKNKSFL